MTNEELVEQIQAGIDVNENLTILYQQNYKTIKRLIFPYSKCFGKATSKTTTVFEIGDLMNDSYFSLFKAVEKYNDSHGVKFMSYAAPFIKLGAKRFIEESNLVHVPVNMSNLIWRYNIFVEKYLTDFKKAPSDDVIKKEFNLTNGQLQNLQKLKSNYLPLSLDFKKKDEDENSLGDTLPIDYNLEDFIIKKLSVEKIKGIWAEVSKTCSDKENYIIHERYVKNRTFISISQDMNLSDDYIRQKEGSAIRKLRKNSTVVEMGKLFNYVQEKETISSVLYYKSPELLAVKNSELDKRFNEILNTYGLTELVYKGAI